jgi:hypothetical protein
VTRVKTDERENRGKKVELFVSRWRPSSINKINKEIKAIQMKMMIQVM